MQSDLSVSSLIFLVATLYSSVGHGGASGYLAILSLCGYAPGVMATTALALNVLVAGLATYSFVRAGHFSTRLALPFMIGSVPAAFVGGSLHIAPGLYYLILAVTLLVVALRLALATDSYTTAPDSSAKLSTLQQVQGTAPAKQSAGLPASMGNEPVNCGAGVVAGLGSGMVPVGDSRSSGLQAGDSVKTQVEPPGSNITVPALISGALIGVLSGVVGIGGGVFLTPLIVLCKWAPAKTAAAISALFIVVNSIAGLIGRFYSGQLDGHIDPLLVVSAFLGGLLGSYLGARKLSEHVLRVVLAFVLVVAAGKLVLISGALSHTFG